MANKPKPKLNSTEIVASYSGKLATGRYENESPFFSIKESWTNVDDDFIRSRQHDLHTICYEKFAECERRALADKIKDLRKDLRFYEYKGDQFPSVTSVINWDKDFYISAEELSQYCARGTIIHKQAEIYLQSGEWKDPKDIPEVYPELVILKKGSLGLTLEGYDFPAFCKKIPIDPISLETVVYSEQHKYAGRCDIKAIVDGKVTLCDIKTGTINKLDAFKQLTAYAHAMGNEDVEQLMIIPLNSTTQQGYSKPHICDDVEKYWTLFLEDRRRFDERFGL